MLIRFPNKKMSRFIQIFDEVSKKVQESVNNRRIQRTFDNFLNTAIDAWCDLLLLDNQQSIRDSIKRKVGEHHVNALIQFHWNEWEKNNCMWISKYREVHSRLLERLLNRQGSNVKFIVLIAFVIVAVGFVIYLLNQEKQQPQQRRDRKDDSPSPPTPPSTLTSPRPPVATVTRECLILVIDAAYMDIVESIRDKGRIDPEDCPRLYEATKYLTVKPPESIVTQFSQVISQDTVSPGEGLSEYDVYLVKIELRQPDAGFGGNVDNQLDRQDAFNRLHELADNVQVSQRLTMQAAEIFDAYTR